MVAVLAPFRNLSLNGTNDALYFSVTRNMASLLTIVESS